MEGVWTVRAPLTPSPLPLMASPLTYHNPGLRHHASPSPGLQAPLLMNFHSTHKPRLRGRRLCEALPACCSTHHCAILY